MSRNKPKRNDKVESAAINNNISNALFQDTMDTNRFLRIVQEKNDKVICKVYFKRRGQLTYMGNTELCKSLFNGGNLKTAGSRVGFTAVG